MKVVIVAGGTPPSKELFLKEIADAELMIAADSGINTFYEYNLTPDILLGDFDSANDKVLKFYDEVKKIKFKPEKDFTDSELAFNKAIECGANEIVLLGCTGTRLDHTFSNIGLLKKALDLGIKAIIKDENNSVFLTSNSMMLFGQYGQTVSFQAFRENVRDFNIKGAKYPLSNYELCFGDGRTVSNEFLEDPIEIKFSFGIVLVIYSRD